MILRGDSTRLKLAGTFDAIITSPPYMNALDYVRDNRLRLWLVRRALPASPDSRAGPRGKRFRQLMIRSLRNILPRLRKGGHLILVIGDCRRGGARIDGATVVTDVLQDVEFEGLVPVATYRDTIPDIRRARREFTGTKKETILVYRKHSGYGRTLIPSLRQ